MLVVVVRRAGNATPDELANAVIRANARTDSCDFKSHVYQVPRLNARDGLYLRRGLDLEEQGADDGAAIEAYRHALDLNPDAAGAWVNIGTLRYRRGELEPAERCYRQALNSSPNYPLAHFNLGNICEELSRFDEAINHYKLALRLQPSYADAHYNLALVFERRSEAMRAAKHWREYLQLDSTSPWARIARQQLNVLLQITQGGRRSDNAV